MKNSNLINSPFTYFKDISSIPRESYNEEKVSDYIVNFAKKNNLRFYRDEFFNVIIYKDSSPEKSHLLPIALQAHLDMVCVKIPEYSFDFDKQGIDFIVTDRLLTANKTSLGADDGVGVSYILSILSDPNLSHPTLECIFTTQEEVGLKGALFLDKSQLKSQRIICLDGSGENRTHVTSAGGLRYSITKKVSTRKKIQRGLMIKLDGFLSGHSASNIHLTNQFPLHVIFKFLEETKIKFSITDILMNYKENELPTACTLSLSVDDPDNMTYALEEYFKTTRKTFLSLLWSIQPIVIKESISINDSKNIISMFLSLPIGCLELSKEFENLPITSNNISTTNYINKLITIKGFARSNNNNQLDNLEKSFIEISKKHNFNFSVTSKYPGWTYKKDSQLRETALSLYKKLYHKDMIIKGGHGGIEAAIFHYMDIFSYGPVIKNQHSVSETLDLDSYDRVYNFIYLLIEML